MKIFKNLKLRDVCFILICAVLVVTQVWLDLTMPDYTQKLTESVSAGDIDMGVVMKNGGMMLLCAVGSMAAAMFCGFFASQVAANFAKTIRDKLFGHILKFSNAEINKFSTPSLITRTTNDVVQLQMFIAMGMQMLIKAPVTAIWAIAKISTSSIEWTTAILVCVGIIVVTISMLVLLAYPKFKSIQKLTDNLNDVTRENISGVRVVRAFNAEKYQEKKFDKVNTAITKNHLFTARIMGIMMPVMTMAMSGLTLAIYWIGAYLINKAEIVERAEVIGNMAAFTQYALQVVGAFMMLVMIFIIMPRTMVSAKRINEVLETEPSINYRNKKFTTSGKGKIEFRNVSFAYSDSGKPCLRNISFDIESGETFAIIGATGTGKSTLVNLIPRYYDVTDGEILIDGKNIKEYPEE
ncbi:MAG: ABC transporter ATP-binding protein, partial [Ruminococcus sp.]|nr:ABC transporter ATP-binding protein [Ruminococcus sp.]